MDLSKLTIEDLRFELGPLAHVIAKRVSEGVAPHPEAISDWRRLNVEYEKRMAGE